MSCGSSRLHDGGTVGFHSAAPSATVSGEGLFLKKKEGRDELEGYAKTLNSKKVSAKNKEALLKELKDKRLVQLNVAEALERAKRAARKPAAFRADFGNLLAGEREGSFSRRGTVDGLW